MLVRVAVQFLVGVFLLSVATCFLAAKRMRAGVSWRRAAVVVVMVALAIGVMGVIHSVFRGDVNASLLDPRPTEHFWPSLFPPGCVLAAGLSFILIQHRDLGGRRVA